MKTTNHRLAQEIPLEEWLTTILDSPNHKQLIDYQFPTDQHYEEYIRTIETRSADDVCRLLAKFLLPSCGLGSDQSRLDSLEHYRKETPDVYEELMRTQYYQRVSNYYLGCSKELPWEGVRWVLDLLPDFPKKALEVLSAYYTAHWHLLPDGRLNGLYDAREIIRAKFIGLPGSNSERIKFLLTSDWRTFECLIERLYNKMGYETQLTPARKDGGRDVIATKSTPGSHEHTRIECKFYHQEPIGLGVVQRLLGVVSGEKVNKGVLVTTSSFTLPAKTYARENARLELIDGKQLVLLMNEHFGADWPLRIDRYAAKSQQR